MADRFWLVWVAVFATATLVAHVLGALFFTDQLWGVHFYAFLPGPVLAIATLATVILVIAVVATGASAERWCDTAPEPEAWPTGRRAAFLAALGVAGAVLGWVLRAGHVLWGDGNPLTKAVARGEWFHPDSPLSMAVHQALHATAGRLFAAAGADPIEAAGSSVALGSALAGGGFALVAWALAGEIARAVPARVPGIRWLVFGALATQGYAQLFFGYVEHYTYVALAIAAFAWLGLRAARDAAPLWACGIVMVAAMGFHLMAVFLVPAFAVLTSFQLARPGRRARAATSLAVVTVAALGLLVGLRALGGAGYHPIAQIAHLADTAASGEGGAPPLLSRTHVRDVLNEQALIGPLALYLLVPAILAFALFRRRGPGPAAAFALALAVPPALAGLLTRDLRLGYARDWDLFAPGAIATTCAGLWLLAGQIERKRTLAIALRITLIVSLYHVVPWIAINTSFARSFERLKLLPLGAGRTESTVGYWYGQMGDFDRARRWLELSLRENPSSLSAYLVLGDLAVAEGRWDDAAEAFLAASDLRPSYTSYRLRRVDALLRAERTEEALTELDAAPNQDDPRLLAMRGVVLWGLGRRDEADSALAAATSSEPRFAVIANELGGDDGYDKVLAAGFDDVIGRAP
jgi:tetratricopeptide (TPR) repeat protein